MADVTPERINIQKEEVAYRSAVSEATMTRVGASLNFINYNQHVLKNFEFNGPYDGPGAGQLNVDGAFPVLKNCKLTGVCLYNMLAGTSGILQVDVRRYTASGIGGTTIFSTKPSISYTSGNVAYSFVDYYPTTTILENPAGTTLGVFSVTDLNAGDILVVDLVTVQTGAQNAGLVLYHIPR